MEGEFKEKFVEYVNNKTGKLSNSFTITNSKRDRVIQCLKNPQLEPSSKFRFWVRQKKFRLLQSEDNEEDIVGIPTDLTIEDDVLYKRVACIEEFFDLISTAHVENGHVGLNQTYSAIRRVYALLPRCVIAKFIQLCPLCRYSSRQYTPRDKGPLSVLPAHRLIDGGNAIKKSEFGLTNAVSAPQSHQFDDLGTVEIITDLTLPASEISGTTKPNDDDVSRVALSQPDDLTSITIVTDPTTPAKLSYQPVESSDSTLLNCEGDNGFAASFIFICHLCGKQFDKKLSYQRHLRTHSEHAPSMSKRIKLESSPHAGVSAGQRRALIVDGDMSAGAVFGLMLAVSQPDVDVLAVTCVTGAVSIEHASRNAVRILRACDRDDIPVFRGAEKPLVAEPTRNVDNVPGASWESDVDVSLVEAEHAVSALIRFINENPGVISLVCLGPLTNLALALRLDHQISCKLKDIFVLGGQADDVGNYGVHADNNLHLDPEAAFIVLKEMSSIYFLPHGTCRRHILPGELFYGLVNSGTIKSDFIRNSGTKEWLDQCVRNGCSAASALAVAMATDESVIVETEDVYTTIELSGRLTYGVMVVVGKDKTVHSQPNVRLASSLDMGRIQTKLSSMVNVQLITLTYRPC